MSALDKGFATIAREVAKEINIPGKIRTGSIEHDGMQPQIEHDTMIPDEGPEVVRGAWVAIWVYVDAEDAKEVE
jgi:hypothetical protein